LDLKTLEKRYIQEESPYCRAACPLQLDARKFCGLMTEGWETNHACVIEAMAMGKMKEAETALEDK
jgi:hypothetical protein